MLHNLVCLTIPKKVIEINKDGAVVEDHAGVRRQVKTLVELAVGDFVLSQQNIVLEKMDQGVAEEMLKILRDGGFANAG